VGRAARPKLTPGQVLQRLQTRLEKWMEALQRVKLAGYEFVISELEVELDYLRRAATNCLSTNCTRIAQRV
jgi:hypothetical protein